MHELQVHQVELEAQNHELRAAQQRLESSRDRHVDFYDFAPCGFVTLNEQGLIREINLTAAAMLGVERSRLLGSAFHLRVAREDAAVFREHLRKLVPPDDRAATELRLVSKRGVMLPVLLQSALVRERETGGFHYRTTITDLSAHNASEEALRRSRVMLARAQEIAHVGSYEVDVVGGTVYLSLEANRILGVDAAGAELSPDASITRHVHPDDAARVRENFHRSVRENGGFELEFRVVRPDGSLRWVHSLAEPLLGADHKTVTLVGTLQDTTERKELEQEILAISERERRRLGQDLHDGLCQRLTALEYFTHNLTTDLKIAAPKLVKQAKRLSRELCGAVTETRMVSHGLCPVAGEPDGLMRGLKELASSVTAMARIRCQFVCPAPVSMADMTAATHLFRIAQEAVNNAVKHSGARRIRISLDRCDGRLKLSVDDNGRGLPSSGAKGDGMGLRVMKYRADIIGARLEIDSGAKKGVRITCSLEEKS